jgi:integrase
MSAVDVAAYLADQAAWLSPNTLTRRLSAIRFAHETLGHPDPTGHQLVRKTLSGIRREHGRPQRRARALSLAEIETMLPAMLGRKGLRDRALTLLGFRAALRRSELISINVEDLAFSEAGLLLHIRRSKVDQTSIGRIVAVPYAVSDTCAVRALQVWLADSNVEAGALFRSIGCQGRLKGRLSAQSVGLILKAYAQAVGVEACGLSAHSLRVGFVTAAVNGGASVHAVQRQTGHKSVDMVYRYVRTGNPFCDNANRSLG